jgi:hypothetical protein
MCRISLIISCLLAVLGTLPESMCANKTSINNADILALLKNRNVPIFSSGKWGGLPSLPGFGRDGLYFDERVQILPFDRELRSLIDWRALHADSADEQRHQRPSE